MTLPAFQSNSGPVALLPPGEHEATFDEIRECFGFTFRRRELLDQLERVVERLFREGAVKIWLDGSFVTGIRNPQDTDVVFLPGDDMDVEALLLAHTDLKRTFRVDLWDYPSYQTKAGVWPVGQKRPITEYFKSTDDGTEKGIVVVRRPT